MGQVENKQEVVDLNLTILIILNVNESVKRSSDWIKMRLSKKLTVNRNSQKDQK